jgi:hypothetical protein
MPARPVMTVTKKMTKNINKIVLNHLTGKKTNVSGMVK